MIGKIMDKLRNYFLERRLTQLLEEKHRIEDEIYTCIEVRRDILDHMRKSDWTKEDEDNIRILNEDIQELRTQHKKLTEEIDQVLVPAA